MSALFGTELVSINSTRTRQLQPLLLRNSRGYFHAKSTVRKQFTSIFDKVNISGDFGDY